MMFKFSVLSICFSDKLSEPNQNYTKTKLTKRKTEAVTPDVDHITAASTVLVDLGRWKHLKPSIENVVKSCAWQI